MAPSAAKSRQHAAPIPDAAPVITQLQHMLVDEIGIRHHRPAVAQASECLSREETKGCRRAKTSRGLTAKLRAQRLSGILDNLEFETRSDSLERPHVGHSAV